MIPCAQIATCKPFHCHQNQPQCQLQCIHAFSAISGSSLLPESQHCPNTANSCNHPDVINAPMKIVWVRRYIWQRSNAIGSGANLWHLRHDVVL